MIAAAVPTTALQDTRLLEPNILSTEDQRALAEIATDPKPYRANATLVAEGARADHVHLLTQGWACRYKTTPEGARQITGLAIPGDICNLDSFMLSELNVGLRTLTTAAVISLPRQRLQAITDERPNIMRAFAWFAIVENAILEEWAWSLGRQSARKRLARLMCELAERLRVVCGNQAQFDLPITQEQIADAIGLTGVHVNRTMQQLRAQGLIVVDGRQIAIPDWAELCREGAFDGQYLCAAPPPVARADRG